MPWTCPRCERSFSREGQSHSCRPAVSVDAHFDGRPPEWRKAFDKLVKALEKEGPLRVDAVASGIHLAAGSTFAGVKFRKDAMRVEWLFDRDVESERIVKREKFSATRHALHVDVEKASQVDAELLGWLRSAYRLRA